MDSLALVQKVQELSDVELAILICLIANQHCILQTEDEFIDGLRDEVQLVRQTKMRFSTGELRSNQVISNTFGLSATVIQCSEKTTLDEFRNGILVDKHILPDYVPAKVGRTLSRMPIIVGNFAIDLLAPFHIFLKIFLISSSISRHCSGTSENLLKRVSSTSDSASLFHFVRRA